MKHLNAFLFSPITAVVCALALLVFVVGTSRTSFSSVSSSEPIADTLLVELLGNDINQNQPPSDEYIARVEAAQRVELGFDISSVLTSIYKKEGQSFKRGELLAKLDIRRLEAEKNELTARSQRAQALLELAENSLTRLRGLETSNNVSKQRLDEAAQQRDAAKGDLDVVKAQLSSVQLEITKSKLFAPFDGIVVDRLTDAGRTVTLGLPILLVEQSGNPEIKVNMPLAAARKLALGQTMQVRHQAQVSEAKIDRINLSLSSSRSAEVYLSAEKRNIALIPGEIIKVELQSEPDSTDVWVPLTALAEYRQGLWSVLIATPKTNGDGTEFILKRSVVTVTNLRGNYARISGGVTPDNRPYVVNQGTHRIVEGQQVRVALVADKTGMTQ